VIKKRESNFSPDTAKYWLKLKVCSVTPLFHSLKIKVLDQKSPFLYIFKDIIKLTNKIINNQRKGSVEKENFNILMSNIITINRKRTTIAPT